MPKRFFEPSLFGETPIVFRPIVADHAASPKDLARCSSPEARAFVDYETAVRLGILPLGLMKVWDEEILTLAVHADPNAELQRAARFAAGREVRLIQVPKELLTPAIFSAYQGDDANLLQGVRQLDHIAVTTPSMQLEFRPRTGEAAQFVATLIDYAIAQQASDIHIIPRTDGAYLKLRMGGLLYSHQHAVAQPHVHAQIINRLKVLASLDTTQSKLPQDGSFSIPLQDHSVQARLSLMPTLHGEKAVIRILGGSGIRTLEELGLEQSVLDLLAEFLSRDEGAVIFAGPTGSGKSTTMYALLHELTKKDLSIVTVEDPVELRLDGVAQTSINDEIGLTYATALRSVLRQDPDVILIGEIRDEESAKVALQAALTGHLVVSTVHARNTAEILLRLESLKLDRLTVLQAVNLLVCQRLLPRLCDHCKVINLAAARASRSEVFQPVGCAQCDYSGFLGQVLAIEAARIDARGEIRPELTFRTSYEKLLRSGKITPEQCSSFGDLDAG